MEQLKFAEQKTETKLKNFIQSISISSGHDIRMFHIELYKTVGAFVQDIDSTEGEKCWKSDKR